jgi:hypothetical protein
MGLIVAGAVSTGGLAALVVKGSRKNNGAGEIQLNSDERENQNATSTQTTISESNTRAS